MIVIFLLILIIFTIITYYFPKITILLILICGYLPQLFLFTNVYEKINIIQQVGIGFRAIDIILIGMVGAVLINLTDHYIIRRPYKYRISKLVFYILIFSLLILFAILRNIPEYKISAPGEFRFRYLVLILPIYITRFFRTEKEIVKLLKIILYFSVMIPVIFIPFVLNNYEGAGSEVFRIFGSAVNLGFLYALIIAFLLWNSKKFKISKYFKIALIPTTILLITDTHRSVWLSALFALLIMIKYNYLKINKITILSIFGIIVFYISLSFIKDIGGIRNPGVYLSNRANDIYTAFEGRQNTGYWRLILWKANLQNVYQDNIMLGKGFGGYWDVYVPELNSVVDVFPHNLYVLTIVKLGILGLFFYFKIFILIYKKIKKYIKYEKKNNKFNYYNKILILFTIILLIQHVYYLMYSFTYLSLLYLGLFYSYCSIILKNKNDLYYNSRS